MTPNVLRISSVAIGSEDDDSMKDQLCTLLITFSDGGNPTNQVTTTHTFVSTDPHHYPQQRTVGWTDCKQKAIEVNSDPNENKPRVTTVFRSAQTPLGPVGKDMIEQEHKTNYHFSPLNHSSSPDTKSKTVRELSVAYETKQLKKGLPRTDPAQLEQSAQVVDLYNQRNACTALSPSAAAISLQTADKPNVAGTRSGPVYAKNESNKLSRSADKLSTEALSPESKATNTKMLSPFKHQARSYESIQESYERNNQHTQISYERQVSEYKSKNSKPAADSKRLSRIGDDFHVYTRYDGHNRPANVDAQEGKRKFRNGGQYIREEFHTEEHYVITKTPLAKNDTNKHSTKFSTSEHQTQKPPQRTQELKVDIGEKKPRIEEDTRQMRLIDYNEYENEVYRLQVEMAKNTTSDKAQISASSPSIVPLTPAIVLPAPPKQNPSKHKSSANLNLTSLYLITKETKDHKSRSVTPKASPTPANASTTTHKDVSRKNDNQRQIQELLTESFQEKIDILKTNKRLGSSSSPHNDFYISEGALSPRHFSPAATRRADSSQHSETYSSPASNTVTSFPATPLPDYARETPPLSSSTPPPQIRGVRTGVRGVLTKEVKHEVINDIVEERKPQKVPANSVNSRDLKDYRTTVFPIHEDIAAVVEPKHIATGKERLVTEEVVESREVFTPSTIKERDEQKYLESLRQNLSLEEQVELEIQRRRRRGENDEMQSELLSIVDEEDESVIANEQHSILTEPERQMEENLVIATRRVYIDTIRDPYIGPLQLLVRQRELSYVEFEPRRSRALVERRDVTIQQDFSTSKRSNKERNFDEQVETEIQRGMAQIGGRTRDIIYYEPKKFDSDRSNSEERTHVSSITVTKSKKASTDELKSNYSYPAIAAPLSRMDSRAEYRSNIASRANFSRPQRTMSPIGSQGFTSTTSSRVLKILTESSSIGSGFSPYGGSSAATTIRDAREREKKEMSDLNDRLASYIEKVRFLEAQNRKLATDLSYLQTRWGQDSTNVRDMYEGDLKQAKRVFDETDKLRRDLLDECNALQDDINVYRRNYDEAIRLRELSKEQQDELLVKFSALESELNLLKRRIANLETDVGVIKRENQHLITSLQRARTDLDQETLNRIDYQNQAQTLLEEIEFLRRAHDSEIRDLQAMASRDTTSENREYFKNELAAAIRDIRTEYDQLNMVNRTDMESWYKLKVSEIQTQSARHNMEQTYAADEIKRLRTQLSDLRGKLADLEGRNAVLEKNLEELNFQLEDDQRNYESALNDRDTQIRKIRDECQMLMVELQMLLDTKQTLDAEIAIYRKMLEGEEDRAGLRQLVEQVVRTHHVRQADESESMRVIRGETSSRHSYQRSAKGNVSIHEASPDGRYIVLENTHRAREEHIGDWKLKRRIDNRRDIVYTFPKDFVLAPGKSVKIWARNQGVLSPPDQLIFNDEDSFGVGNNVQTILYNTQGEERATLIQRSSTQV